MDVSRKMARRDSKRSQRAASSEKCKKRVDIAQKSPPRCPKMAPRRPVRNVMFLPGPFLTGSGGEGKTADKAREDNLRKNAFRIAYASNFEHAKNSAKDGGVRFVR